ncbi:MAG: MvaI/BcnI restriction endonuclease family protein [Chloroflexi bacterium]|nr:MvaI/BcnI restriction endonuclease family protein [Chloroflexota bacterium]
MRLLTKGQMVEQFRTVWRRGWIRSLRPLNSGGIGNTIDALLGFPENNLPIADTAQWELKTHRAGSSSLLTLFHMEPEPRKARVVASLLLPKYGWPDQAGRPNELSFRQTLGATGPTDRGFRVSVDRAEERINVHFDSGAVHSRHKEWLQSVIARVGLGPLNPQPYWRFQDLFLKASTKMLNSFYVEAETQRSDGEEYFRIQSVLILQGFELDHFLAAIENGLALVDFDARTHHNHGTKFRLRLDWVPRLYRYTEKAI